MNHMDTEAVSSSVMRETEYIRTPKGSFHIILEMSDKDRIGCVVDSLRIEPVGDARLSIDPFQLSESLFPLDGFAVIEYEAPRQKALLKSALPRTIGSTIEFFEVIVDPLEGLVLRKYVYDRSRECRFPQAFSLTRDALERLVASLKGMVQAGSRP